VKTILHNGLHLRQLIESVLELATLESGHVSVSRQAVPVPELIDGLLAALPVLFKGKRLKLVKDVAADIPPLHTDPVMLKQILFNLLGNAVKFTEQGEIRVAAVREGGGTPRLVLRVRDTGIGIPADKLGIIFEPFQQAHEGINRHYGGSGIGLSIARSLAEALGGSISVESQEGKGSTFTVKLPYTA
jgi:signal transduction histidine kinase